MSNTMMKCTVLQEDLSKGLEIVGRAVSSRDTTLLQLKHVLLATDGGQLRLSATNLRIGITCWLGAQVEGEGAISVPARTLIDLVKILSVGTDAPVGTVDMALNEANLKLNLRGGRTEANLNGLMAEEFPTVMLPGDDEEAITVEADVLCQAIDQVAYSASDDENRMTLSGVNAEFEGAQLTLAAADGFRLAVRTIPLDQPVADAFSMIVPARALAELSRIVKKQAAGPVEIIVPTVGGPAVVFFRVGDVVLSSQLIEGKFPEYQKIIPPERTTRTVVDRAAFLGACKKALVFARDNGHIARLKIEHGLPGCINVLARSAESGDDRSVVDANIEGDEVEINFNVKYLIKVLSVLGTPQVALETTTAASPGVIRPVGDVDYTHVIMPMHSDR